MKQWVNQLKLRNQLAEYPYSNINKHVHIESSSSTTSTIIHPATHIKIVIQNQKAETQHQIHSAAGFHLFKLVTLLSINYQYTLVMLSMESDLKKQ